MGNQLICYPGVDLFNIRALDESLLERKRGYLSRDLPEWLYILARNIQINGSKRTMAPFSAK